VIALPIAGLAPEDKPGLAFLSFEAQARLGAEIGGDSLSTKISAISFVSGHHPIFDSMSSVPPPRLAGRGNFNTQPPMPSSCSEKIIRAVDLHRARLYRRQRSQACGESLDAADIVIFGELDRPAIFEGAEIGDLGLQHSAGPAMAEANGNFDTGVVLMDDQFARVEEQDLEVFSNEAEALKRRPFAVGDTT
jgi:hypothetical protein